MKRFLKEFWEYFVRKQLWTVYMCMVFGFSVPMLLVLGSGIQTESFWKGQLYLWTIAPVLVTLVFMFLFYLYDYSGNPKKRKQR